MDDERVYVPLQSEALMALNRETGAIEWMRAIESAWPPVVHDDVVYLAASDELHALSASTGDTRWRVPLERLAAPLVHDTGWLLAVVEPGEVIAMRAADGRQVWRQPMGAALRSRAVPGDNDALYFTLADGRVVSLNLSDGAKRWEQQLPPQMLSEPSSAEDRVFVGSTDNFLYALDAGEGTLQWKWRSGGDVIGAASTDDVVFITSLDNIIRGVNRGNGNQRWRKATPSRPAIPPRATAGVALVTGIDNSLTAFAARTGEQVGTYVAPADLQGPALIDPVLKPFRVAAAIVMRDGRVAGLHPLAMLFREQPMTPVTALPGRILQREQLSPRK